MRHISIQPQDFSIDEEVSRLAHPGVGAQVTFTGLVRDVPGGGLRSLFLEHYPGMTEKALAAIADEAAERWRLDGIVIIHRVGELRLGDRIVLVATASGHRADAFQGAEFLMDYLKTRAPFWKKESLESGTRWVDARASDDDAAQRWQG